MAMEEIIRLDSVADYNVLRGAETLHPQITVLDLAKAIPMAARTFSFGLYAIYLKELKCGELKYGRSHYDYQEGTLVFVAPGQVMTIQPGVTTFEPKGWALLFDPELIRGTSLGKRIQEYSFFSYDVNEALHLSEKERQIVLDLFSKIRYELEQSIDKHSRKLISANIELLLDYCNRFYDRQFITRDQVNSGILGRFESLLNKYFADRNLSENGIPTVAWCASELNLSANYFGDVIKKETGKTAQEYIRGKLIGVAKELIFDPEKSVSEVAYSLGFKYPHHFARVFKKETGCTPNEYRHLN